MRARLNMRTAERVEAVTTDESPTSSASFGLKWTWCRWAWGDISSWNTGRSDGSLCLARQQHLDGDEEEGVGPEADDAGSATEDTA
jgi:hypothetical protein